MPESRLNALHELLEATVGTVTVTIYRHDFEALLSLADAVELYIPWTQGKGDGELGQIVYSELCSRLARVKETPDAQG